MILLHPLAQNEYVLVKFGVDTTENELSKIWPACLLPLWVKSTYMEGVLLRHALNRHEPDRGLESGGDVSQIRCLLQAQHLVVRPQRIELHAYVALNSFKIWFLGADGCHMMFSR